MVLFFIILFVLIGFIIAKKYRNQSLIFYILMSFFWFFVMGPFWAVITFIELITGWGLQKIIKDFFRKDKEDIANSNIQMTKTTNAKIKKETISYNDYEVKDIIEQKDLFKSDEIIEKKIKYIESVEHGIEEKETTSNKNIKEDIEKLKTKSNLTIKERLILLREKIKDELNIEQCNLLNDDMINIFIKNDIQTQDIFLQKVPLSLREKILPKEADYLNEVFEIIKKNNTFIEKNTESPGKKNCQIDDTIQKTYPLYGPWAKGWALDIHTISSIKIDDYNYITTRTNLGNLLYELKYKNKFENIEIIGNVIVEFIKNKNLSKEIDIILPVPFSKKRKIQPLYEIAKYIGRNLKKSVDLSYLKKKATPKELKNINNLSKRKKILVDTLDIKNSKYKGKTILLLDDIYRSGSTLITICNLLYKKGKVKKIYVLCITKTRTKQ
ncbi:ComF family protein [Nautilia sp.]